MFNDNLTNEYGEPVKGGSDLDILGKPKPAPNALKVFGKWYIPGSKPADESKIRDAATKAGSTPENNKPFMVNGKKMGWTKIGNKWTPVDWGTVAGEAKVGANKAKGKEAAAKQGVDPKTGKKLSARDQKAAEAEKQAQKEKTDADRMRKILGNQDKQYDASLKKAADDLKNTPGGQNMSPDQLMNAAKKNVQNKSWQDNMAKGILAKIEAEKKEPANETAGMRNLRLGRLQVAEATLKKLMDGGYSMPYDEGGALPYLDPSLSPAKAGKIKRGQIALGYIGPEVDLGNWKDHLEGRCAKCLEFDEICNCKKR